jgi:hypothetical protein
MYEIRRDSVSQGTVLARLSLFNLSPFAFEEELVPANGALGSVSATVSTRIETGGTARQLDDASTEQVDGDQRRDRHP